MIINWILFGLLSVLLLISLILMFFLIKAWVVYKYSCKSTDLIFTWIILQLSLNPEFDVTKDWYRHFEKDFNYCILHPFIWTTRQMWWNPAEYDEVVKYVKEHIKDGCNFLDID